MRLISLWEPWATLIALGAKKVETRSWQTPYRGLVAIHASKGGLGKYALAEQLAASPEFGKALSGERLNFGHIVAVVNLVECLPTATVVCLPGVFDDYPLLDTPQERAFGDFTPGRWAWVMDKLLRLPQPIAYKAHQGLCVLDPLTDAKIWGQLR